MASLTQWCKEETWLSHSLFLFWHKEAIFVIHRGRERRNVGRRGQETRVLATGLPEVRCVIWTRTFLNSTFFTYR